MADEVAERRERAQKHSKNDEANEIIELLRQAAVKLVKLGDDFEALKAEYGTKCQQYNTLEEQYVHLTEYGETHEEWEELLLNFRSGIIDKGEVLAGTVGAQ